MLHRRTEIPTKEPRPSSPRNLCSTNPSSHVVGELRYKRTYGRSDYEHPGATGGGQKLYVVKRMGRIGVYKPDLGGAARYQIDDKVHL